MVGARIREKRLAAGHTSQDRFAYLAKIDRVYYGQIEAGYSNVSLLKLCQIAKALQIEVNELTPTLKEINEYLKEE